MISSAEVDDRIVKCQKILDVDPNSQIFAALAEAYRKKGELEKAFRICQNGLKVHPSYGSAHVVMSKINLDRGLYDWAEAEARKAAELDGWTRTIELLLAEIAIYKGEFAKAVKLLKKLNQANPDNTQIQKLLEIASRIPEEQSAIVGEETVIERQADDQPSREGREPAKSLSRQDIVEQGIRIAGVDGVLFVNQEGLVIESEWTLKLDPAACAATLGDVGRHLNQELVKGSFGYFRAILVETEQLTYYLLKVKDGLFLFVANESANLGTLRMKIENLLVHYR